MAAYAGDGSPPNEAVVRRGPSGTWGSRLLRGLAGLVISLLVGAAIWGAWLGWDHTYYYDAEVGAQQGPYRPAQVVACAVTVGLATALLALRWQPFLVATGITVGFCLVWTIDAGRQDSSGLYVVGAVLLFCGLVLGTSIAATIGYLARPLLQRLGARRSAAPRL